jgi:hypothetical protein
MDNITDALLEIIFLKIVGFIICDSLLIAINYQYLDCPDYRHKIPRISASY